MSFPESQTICGVLILCQTHPYGKDPYFKRKDLKDKTRDGPLVTMVQCIAFENYFNILDYDQSELKMNQRKWSINGIVLDDLFKHLNSDLTVMIELGDMLSVNKGKHLFMKTGQSFLEEMPVINIKPPFGNAVLRRYKKQESHKNFAIQSCPAEYIYPVDRKDYVCRGCVNGYTGDCYCDARTQALKKRDQETS